MNGSPLYWQVKAMQNNPMDDKRRLSATDPHGPTQTPKSDLSGSVQPEKKLPLSM
jgi:hypothetical protein